MIHFVSVLGDSSIQDITTFSSMPHIPNVGDSFEHVTYLDGEQQIRTYIVRSRIFHSAEFADVQAPEHTVTIVCERFIEV